LLRTEEREHNSAIGYLEIECLIENCKSYTGVHVNRNTTGSQTGFVGQVDGRGGSTDVWNPPCKAKGQSRSWNLCCNGSCYAELYIRLTCGSFTMHSCNTHEAILACLDRITGNVSTGDDLGNVCGRITSLFFDIQSCMIE